MRRPAGFTLVEIIVVLLLMSIIGAMVFGRSVTTTQIDLSSEADKIRNHLRYAQAEAMKLAYKDTGKDYPVWGIRFEPGQYWLFRGTNPDNAAEQVRLPGVDYPSGNKVSLPSGFSLATTPSNTVYFNRIGKPYRGYISETNNAPLNEEMTITVAHGESRTIRIEPETGLVR